MKLTNAQRVALRHMEGHRRLGMGDMKHHRKLAVAESLAALGLVEAVAADWHYWRLTADGEAIAAEMRKE